jgi:hypothetical protein
MDVEIVGRRLENIAFRSDFDANLHSVTVPNSKMTDEGRVAFWTTPILAFGLTEGRLCAGSPAPLI